VVIIGPWEVSTADLFDTVRNIPFGFKLGDLRLSVREILTAAAALVLLLIVTRMVQRWLEKELLPRTRIEPSLQLSIVTIFGYLGGITAIALALAALGVDLQKIAFIAGALSVGIGFGLQSVVSNFVSGLILLTERPIRWGTPSRSRARRAGCGACACARPRSRPSIARASSFPIRSSSPAWSRTGRAPIRSAASS
jgi:small-conductance mechanosensitive channel